MLDNLPDIPRRWQAWIRVRQDLAPDCSLWLVLPPRSAHSAYGARSLLIALSSQRSRWFPNMPILFAFWLAWDQTTSLSWVDRATQEEIETVQECAWEVMGLMASRADGRLTMGEQSNSIAFLWPPRMYWRARSGRHKLDRGAVRE